MEDRGKTFGLGRGGKGRKARRLRRVMCWTLAGLMATSSGCTRRFFRNEADKEVAITLGEKDHYPAWKIEQFHVYPDPRARFADPTNPDRPPMPPDDPAADAESPHPQKPGKAGIGYVTGTGYLDLLAKWDEENRAEAVAAKEKAEAKSKPQTDSGEESEEANQDKKETQPPEKLTVPPKEEKSEPTAPETPKKSTEPALASTALSTKVKPGKRPPFLVKLEQAVELGLINSREFQDARENLYLIALPVTLERFAFSAQVFAAEQYLRRWVGSGEPGGHRNDSTFTSNVGVAKLFSTGALLLFNFANQTVFNLTGVGRSVTSQSTINFDIIQPLLRGGGRAVALEPLTLAERNLLYGIRDFARFRKTFYVAIAGGGGGSITGAQFQPTGVIASPTFAPGVGLGSSGLIPGVIEPIPLTGDNNLQVNPGGSGRNALQVALAAPVSGYLTTLLDAALIRVDEYNIEKIEGYLKLAKALEEGGDISGLQVDQFEQQLLQRRTSLLQDQLRYLQSLDQFKLQLGLPTELSIELDDAPFRPLNQQFQRYEDLFRQFLTASNAPSSFGALELVPKVRGELRRIFQNTPITQGTRFREQIGNRWSAWEKLSADDLRKRLASYAEERRRLLDRKSDLETKGQSLSPAEQQRVNELSFEIDLGTFETALREYESQPWRKLPTPEAQRRDQQRGFRIVQNTFINVLIEARNERVEQLRAIWPDLARLCVDGVDLIKADLEDSEAAVVRHALLNRLDLMNVRAQMVDAWRQIAIFANSLLGTFNVQYHVDATTPPGGSNPLALGGRRTNHDLILNTELPLVRLPERNNYRASLINYQRFRRILQRAEDQVAFDVRGEIRQLRQLEELYRIQQRQVELAYLVVENSLDTFQAPLAPGQLNADPATRAASLTTQLINAQTSLFQAQTQMNTIWINYLNTRLQLYRDMELMPLDTRGVWIDDVANCECPDRDAGRSPGPGASQPDAATGKRDGAEQ
jgi:outer membrane protein TolC